MGENAACRANTLAKFCSQTTYNHSKLAVKSFNIVKNITKMGENIKSLKKENDKLRDQVFNFSLISLTDYLSGVRPICVT